VTKLGSARAAAAVAVGALALLSAAITVPKSWSWTSDQRDAFAGIEPSPTLVFRYQQLLPADAVAFVREHVRTKERYLLLVREGGVLVAGVSPESAARAFARYALLPAVQVQDVQHADVVVGLGVDPGTLKLRYSRVDWEPGGTGVAVGRIAR
jgi:hypothetical protein